MVANVGADSHVDHSQILNAEVLGIETAKNSKATTIIDIFINGLQLGTKDGQDKVVLVDLGAVQAEI